MVNRAAQSLRWPTPACILCNLASDSALPLCAECRCCLIQNQTACSRCALPLPDQTHLLCGQCQTHPPPYYNAIVPWRYEEHLAYIIKQWKFHQATWLSALLATLWHQGLQAFTVNALEVDAIIPVPLHWRRRWQRGYNQSLLLARAINTAARPRPTPPIKEHCLYRTRHTAAQSGMNARQRRRNMSNAFGVRGQLTGLHVALIDDVMTTGTTLSAAATTLLDAGAERVTVWALARAIKD